MKPRTSRLEIRVTVVEKRNWSRVADREAMTLSDWIRRRLNDVVAAERA
jgi:hypothetical protein